MPLPQDPPGVGANHETSPDVPFALVQNLTHTISFFSHVNRPRSYDGVLRPSELGALMCLHRREAEGKPPFTPSEMSSRMGMTRSAMSPVLARLEEMQFVERILSKDDKRRFHLRLTQQGKAYIEAQAHRFYDTVSRLVDYLGEEDAEELLRLLGRAGDFFRQHNGRDAHHCGDCPGHSSKDA